MDDILLIFSIVHIFVEYQSCASHEMRMEGADALMCSVIMFEFERVRILFINEKKKKLSDQTIILI